MSTGKTYVLTLTMVSPDPQFVLKTTEVFARASAGLVLDGVSVNFMLAEAEVEIEDNDDVEVGGTDD